jgi:hypothetical protein
MVCFALILVISSFTLVFKDVKRSQESPSPAILFIDELHLISVGKGQGGQSGMYVLLSHRRYTPKLIFIYRDAANLLKPELARGQFRCIGATTLAEYREHIEKDGALTRRFAQVCTVLMRRDGTITGLIGHSQRANNRSSQNYSTWLSGALRKSPPRLDHGSSNSYCSRTRPQVSHCKEVCVHFVISESPSNSSI